MSDQTDKPLLTDRFTAATAYALDHHRTQIRKGSGVPYASHLFAVTAIVLEMGGSEDEAIAALLHDVIEDGGGRAAEAEIRERWGDDVADWVLANSDSTTGSIEGKEDWMTRKERYVAGIDTKPIEAVRVSIADKLHNSRMIVADSRAAGDGLWDRFTADGPQTLWYYEALLEAFEARRGELGTGAGRALDELERSVAELRAIVEITSRRSPPSSDPHPR